MKCLSNWEKKEFQCEHDFKQKKSSDGHIFVFGFWIIHFYIFGDFLLKKFMSITKHNSDFMLTVLKLHFFINTEMNKFFALGTNQKVWDVQMFYFSHYFANLIQLYRHFGPDQN